MRVFVGLRARARGLGMTLCAVLLAASEAGAQQAGPDRTRGDVQLAQGVVAEQQPVRFTAAQSERGKKQYLKACLDCHGKDLKGGLNGGAPLRGQQFETRFVNGAPASALFLYMSTLMPPNSPGRFSPSTYADLMAYVLDRNRFRAGGQELPSDIDALDNIIVAR